ncbi:MAG: nucleoside-triphosphatase [Candidatus Ratteibacteria bacterium]
MVTGIPGCGKTTLIKEILSIIPINKKGFFTEEIKEKGKRAGFKIITFSGKEGIFAHQNFAFPFRVSKYSVSISVLEDTGVKEIEEGLKQSCLIVIDEIGKMELFSEKFRKVVMAAFESKNRVLGTVLFAPHPFCDEIKKRKDTQIFVLEKHNYQQLKQTLINLLQ